MYTLILMSSRKGLVYQQAVTRGHTLLFWIIVSALFFSGVGSLGYGLFQKQRKAVAEEDLRMSIAQVEALTRDKHQAESALVAIDAEMQDIRQIVNQIQRTLGIFDQGGGQSDVPLVPEETKEEVNPIRESAAPQAAVPEIPTEQALLTPSLLKQEIQPLYEYVRSYSEVLDNHPSILPVSLEEANGEKYGFWYSSHFGWRVHPLTKRREFHKGLDIKTRSGIPVIAAANGIVVKVETETYLGNIVEIRHEASQLKTLYAHLKGYVEGLKVGQEVSRGQTIGYVGNTGRSTGAHLHYGIYDITAEKWVNPLAYIFDQQPTFSP